MWNCQFCETEVSESCDYCPTCEFAGCTKGEHHCCDKTMEAFTPSEVAEDELLEIARLVQECSECGSEFVGAGFPIGREGCWISNPNCGNCYGYVDGVPQG